MNGGRHNPRLTSSEVASLLTQYNLENSLIGKRKPINAMEICQRLNVLLIISNNTMNNRNIKQKHFGYMKI